MLMLLMKNTISASDDKNPAINLKRSLHWKKVISASDDKTRKTNFLEKTISASDDKTPS